MRCMILLCAAVACLLLAAGCTESAPQQAAAVPTETTGAAPAAEDTTAAPTTVATTSSVSDNTVSIYEMSFDPATITVKTGSIVRWVNRDSAVHSIIFSDSSIPSSNILSPSQSFATIKLNTPGTYTYHCGVHPKVTGTIIVTD